MERAVLVKSIKFAGVAAIAAVGDMFLRRDKEGRLRIDTRNIRTVRRLMPQRPKVQVINTGNLQQVGPARYDVQTTQDHTVGIMGTLTISVGYIYNKPKHVEAHIIGTSTLARKGLMVMPMVIGDSGEISLTITNHKARPQKIQQGTNIARLYFIAPDKSKRYQLVQGGHTDVSR